jgi:hypothetical protein
MTIFQILDENFLKGLTEVNIKGNATFSSLGFIKMDLLGQLTWYFYLGGFLPHTDPNTVKNAIRWIKNSKC